jgi:hypothetical protein
MTSYSSNNYELVLCAEAAVSINCTLLPCAQGVTRAILLPHLMNDERGLHTHLISDGQSWGPSEG